MVPVKKQHRKTAMGLTNAFPSEFSQNKTNTQQRSVSTIVTDLVKRNDNFDPQLAALHEPLKEKKPKKIRRENILQQQQFSDETSILYEKMKNDNKVTIQSDRGQKAWDSILRGKKALNNGGTSRDNSKSPPLAQLTKPEKKTAKA